METIIKSRKFEDGYIRNIVAMQNERLSIRSKYYKGNIAEGNWSLVEDSNIEKFNVMFDGAKEIEGVSKKEKDAEYEYVFIPSYYSVKSLILYYMKNKEQAERIYGLKNAITGGLTFIFKYIGGDFEDDRIDLNDFVEELLDYERHLEYSDDFINNIIDCLCSFYGKDLILERRIKEYNESKQNWFIIDFYNIRIYC